MIDLMELPEEENQPKQTAGANRTFTQQDIRASIQAQRERIRYMMELMEEADVELKAKRKVEERNKTINDFLNGEGLI